MLGVKLPKFLEYRIVDFLRKLSCLCGSALFVEKPHLAVCEKCKSDCADGDEAVNYN